MTGKGTGGKGSGDGRRRRDDRGRSAGRSGGSSGRSARGGQGGRGSSDRGRGSSDGGSSRSHRSGSDSPRRGSGGGGSGKRDGGGSPRVARKDLSAARAVLPRWVIDELTRTTSSAKSGAAIESLAKASEAFQAGAFQRAARHAVRAKEMAPRYPYIREVLGLASYRAGDWERGLSELRSYRRMSGDTTHLPVEMDILRALGRDRAVADAWEELQRRGGKATTMKEGLVVFTSYLLDQGRVDEAWELLGPQRVGSQPGDADRRVWYVAARAAAARGDAATASKLRNAILETDPGFPGIDELEAEIAAAGRA